MEPTILLQCTHYSQIILHNFNDHCNSCIAVLLTIAHSLLRIVLVACQKNTSTVAVIMRIHQWQIQKMFFSMTSNLQSSVNMHI